MLQQHPHVDRLVTAFSFLVVFALVATGASAATIFSDGFENQTFGSQWRVYDSPSGSNNWLVSTTNPLTGSRHAQVTQPGASRWAYLELNISTLDYSNITLNYSRRLIGLDPADGWRVEWWNGQSWVVVENKGSNSANDASYQSRQYTLPSSVAESEELLIRWSCQAGAVSEICRVDDVNVTGTLTSEFNPPPPPAPAAEFSYSYELVNGKYVFTLQPVYTLPNGTKVPVNNTLVPSPLSGYHSAVVTGAYEAHFKRLASTTSTVLLRRGVDLSFDPEGIYWDSTAGNNIIDANPGGAGAPDPNRPNAFVYPNAYGNGIHLEYLYYAGELKENIIVDDRSLLGNPSGVVAAGANLSLRLDFAIHNTNNLDLYVDGSLWASTGKVTGVKEAQFRQGEETVFTLHTPVAFDSNGSSVEGFYNFRRTLGSLWVEQHFPFDWVNSTERVYPVVFDPTTEVEGFNDTVVLDLSDPAFDPIIQVTLYNVSDTGTLNNLILDPIINNTLGIEEYAIDPSGVAFERGEVSVSQAQGDLLFKCATYNITDNTCPPHPETGETWVVLSELVRGEPYTVDIDPADPGFYELQLALGEQTTSSNTYVDATSLSFNVSRQGNYVVIVTYQQRGTSTIGNRYFQSRALLDGTPFFENIYKPISGTATSEYLSFMGHTLANLSVGSHSVVVQHSRSVAPQSSLIKNIRVHVFDAEAFYIQQSGSNINTSSVTIPTTPANVSLFNYTADQTAAQLFLYSGEQSLQSTAQTYTITLGTALNGTETIFTNQPTDTGNVRLIGAMLSRNRTIATSDQLFYQHQLSSATTSFTRNARVTEIKLLPEYDPQRFSDRNNLVFSGTTPVTSANLTFTPQYPNTQYLFLFSASYGHTGGAGVVMSAFVNGTEACNAPMASALSGERVPFVCSFVMNVSNTAPITATMQVVGQNPGSNGEVNYQHITAFRITPLPTNDLLCYPKPNKNWTINEPIICDNVTRNTGAGQLIIANNGTVQLINNAQLYTSGYQLTRWNPSLPWLINIQRGSNLYVTR